MGNLMDKLEIESVKAIIEKGIIYATALSVLGVFGGCGGIRPLKTKSPNEQMYFFQKPTQDSPSKPIQYFTPKPPQDSTPETKSPMFFYEKPKPFDGERYCSNEKKDDGLRI
jgi:hypothetical protein